MIATLRFFVICGRLLARRSLAFSGAVVKIGISQGVLPVSLVFRIFLNLKYLNLTSAIISFFS